MVPNAEIDAAADATLSSAAARGRPRAAGRTDEILVATIELFEEVGYDHLRIQDVADRAGAGLATIYRRWPNKQALMADALRHKSRLLAAEPLTGDARTDLTELYRSVAEHACGPRAEFLPGFFAAIRSEPVLREAFCETILDRVRGQAKKHLEVLLGADHPHLEMLADMVPAIVIYRSLVPGTPEVEPERFAAEAIELVLACARSLPAAD